MMTFPTEWKNKKMFQTTNIHQPVTNQFKSWMVDIALVGWACPTKA